MAFSMNLRDLTSPQYGAVTGKKRKTPYTSVLIGAGPSVREAARQKELDAIREKEFLQGVTEFDTTLKQGAEQFNEGQAQNATQFNTSLAQGAEQFNAAQALERTLQAAQEAEAEKASKISLAQTGLAATYMADQAGIINLKDVASGVGKKIWPTAPVPVAGAEALTGAGPIVGDAGSLEGVTAESLAGTSVAGGGGVPAAGAGPTIGGAGTVLAYVAAADMARQKWGQLDTPYADRNAPGKVTSAPVTGGPPAILEALGVNSSNEFVKPMNQLAAGEEKLVGEPLDLAFSGDILGSLEAFGKAAVTSAPRAVYNSIPLLPDTWLCTEIKKHVGVTSHERSAIRKLRRYARKTDPGWLNSYQIQGPELVRGIAAREGDNLVEFYESLKTRLVDPVADLIDAGNMDAAFTAYKDETIRLCRIYAPEIRIEEMKEATR